MIPTETKQEIPTPTQTEVSTLAELRADISLTREFAYFQTGSEGPVPDSTQALMCATIREENGPALRGRNAYGRLLQRAEMGLQTLADFLGASADTIAWTQNTSAANRLAAGSLGWKAGDRLALTGTEHVSTRIMARGVEQITGQKTTIVPVGPGHCYSPADFLQQLDQLLTPDHKLFIISHVSCIDGRRLPVAEATRLAHERGVKVLVDGAQAAGQFPIDVGQIGADFYAGSVHKWLLGPAGIGYLVVAGSQLQEYHPNLVPHPFPEEWGGNDRKITALAQTQTGTETMSLRMGAGHVVQMFERIGMAAIEAHICRLATRLRDGLQRIPGFSILGPTDWDLSSGITSLDFPGKSTVQVHALIDRIWDEHSTVVKFQSDFAGIRISTAPFNTEEEVDRLLEALERFVPAM